MKAYIKVDFLSLFLYENEITDNCVDIDLDCLVEWNIGDELEVLKEIEIGEFAKNTKSYVVFNPKTSESITLAECFLKFD